MDSFHCFSLFTFSLLISWSYATATTTTTITGPVLPQPSSAFLAADTLRIRGYSIFASLLVSISSTTNFSGTLLAPPDFAFSFASSRLRNHHRPPPRPSVPVLLYHSLRPPLILTWPTISSRDDGDELRTFYNNNCLYLLKSTRASDISISSSPFTNPIATVKIRQPDLYVDEHLIVHGIDGVLNPSFATRCSVTYSDPTAETVPLQVNRVFLDRAMRALRRNGYNVVASAMSIRRSDLLPLTSVTVLAVSDEHLFMTPGGFHYDFRHHVVPIRQRFTDLARIAARARGIEFHTLSPNKTVRIVSNAGAVSVDGVPVGMREVYHNRWMVVVSVLASLDTSLTAPPPEEAVADSAPSPAPIPRFSEKSPNLRVSAKGRSHSALSPDPIHRIFGKGRSHRVPSPAPAPAHKEKSEDQSPAPAPEAFDGAADSYPDWMVPSPAVELNGNEDFLSRSPSPAPETEGAEYLVASPVPSPATHGVNVVHCDLNVVISDGVEGGDLLCPGRPTRRLRETGGYDVEGYQPLDANSQDSDDLTRFDDVKLSEHVNIADDVFFYT
ncbi:hypothetical protein SASPL_116770 [Salvia splendens]|uniref:Uncharacterized protein n=1 Tax=Salvia splendens TaxID=180675 RepID=A0A8X8XUB8_SALSN|nr:hypothetical protein SASPL_116770 [Salvia splendens]